MVKRLRLCGQARNAGFRYYKDSFSYLYESFRVRARL